MPMDWLLSCGNDYVDSLEILEKVINEHLEQNRENNELEQREKLLQEDNKTINIPLGDLRWTSQ